MTRTRAHALTAAAVAAVLTGVPLVGGGGSTSALWRDTLTLPFPAVTAGDPREVPGQVEVIEGWAPTKEFPGGEPPPDWPSNANAYSTVNFRLFDPGAVGGYLAFHLHAPSGKVWVWLNGKEANLDNTRIPITPELLESGIDLLLHKNSMSGETVFLDVAWFDGNSALLASSTLPIPWKIRVTAPASVADPVVAPEHDLAGATGAGPDPDEDGETVPRPSGSPADGSDPGHSAPEPAVDPEQSESELLDREAAEEAGREAAREAAVHVAEQAAARAAETAADLKLAEAEAVQRAEEAADARTAADEAARRLAEAEAAGADAEVEAARSAADEATRTAAEAEAAWQEAEAEVVRRAIEAEAARVVAEQAAREVDR